MSHRNFNVKAKSVISTRSWCSCVVSQAAANASSNHNNGRNGEKYFEIKEINEVIAILDITASDVKSSDWKDVWCEYTTKPRGNSLLWRTVILQEEFIVDTRDYVTTVMFSFNHSSIDGVSCVKFCKKFLRHLNKLADGATVDQEIPSLNMLPYYHDIVTQKRSLYSVLNFMLTYCGLRPVLRFLVKRMISYHLETIKVQSILQSVSTKSGCL